MADTRIATCLESTNLGESMPRQIFFKAVRAPAEGPPAYLLELLQTVLQHAREADSAASRLPTPSRQIKTKFFAGGDYGQSNVRRRA